MKKLIVLSGPSGVGKDTVAQRVTQQLPTVVKVKTATTRPQRQEANGMVDNTYDYLSDKHFLDWIEKDRFLEYAHVHQWWYGSPKASVEKIRNEGKIPLLIIDVQGAQAVKNVYGDQAITIFINYDPSTDIQDRLKEARPGISVEELNSRLASAKKEIAQADTFDYQVVNVANHPEKAAEEIIKIVKKYD